MEARISYNERGYNVRRGDVYYIDLPGIKNTSLQTGDRTCVVVSNDMNNIHSSMITVVPTTTQSKKNIPTHVDIFGGNGATKFNSTVLCEQILTVPKSLITGYAGRVDDLSMKKIEKAIGIQTGTIKRERLDEEYIREALEDLECEINDFIRYQTKRHRRNVELIIKDIKIHCDKAGVNSDKYVGKYEKYIKEGESNHSN